MDAYLQRLQEAITSATRGMTAEDLRRHPEGKWSTAEVLEHLYLTYTGTVKAFERCLHEGKPLARTPMLKDRMRAFVVTGLGHIPEGRKAPERTQPRGMVADEVRREIGPRISAMDEVIAQCEARFGKRTRVLHPFSCEAQHRTWQRAGPMALGGRTDVCLVESIPAAARALRKAGGHSRGILVLGVCSDLLALPASRLGGGLS